MMLFYNAVSEVANLCREFQSDIMKNLFSIVNIVEHQTSLPRKGADSLSKEIIRTSLGKTARAWVQEPGQGCQLVWHWGGSADGIHKHVSSYITVCILKAYSKAEILRLLCLEEIKTYERELVKKQSGKDSVQPARKDC